METAPRIRRCLATLLLAGSCALAQQIPPAPPTSPPPEPAVNYNEANVGTYTLPNPLVLNDGKPVRSAQQWFAERRPQILSLFETEQFGKAPGRPADESFQVSDPGTPALHGTAIRRQVMIYFSKDHSGPAIQLLVYLPAAAKKPVPVLLNLNFGAVQDAVDDPGIRPETVWNPKTHTRGAPFLHGFGRLDANALIAAGIGVATFYYGDVDPDDPEGFPSGIRAFTAPAGATQANRPPDAWGAIAAWAWGLSRAQDYLETDSGVDSRRVALFGISRLGKTVLWAGAHDTRFAAVIASCSGEGGAALSRRNFGETIANLTSPTRFLYQFAPNYARWAGFPDHAPIDANLLIALIAPRPLLLQTSSTDLWSDPKGEFLAAVAAGPVYRLLGRQDLGTTQWPAANHPIFSNGLNYFMHQGGHGILPSDWTVFLTFLRDSLHPQP